MAKNGESGEPIENLTPGTGIWISESGTLKQWIYLGKDENGNCQLLREKTYETRRINATTMATVNYDGTEMDTFLSGTFLSRFSAKVQGYLTATSVSHQVYTTSTSTSSYPTMNRKCYLPTLKQLGFGGSEAGLSLLSALKTFYNTTSDNTARKAYNESGTNVQHWLSSAYTQENRFRNVQTGGQITYNQSTNSSVITFRPILSFAATTPVKDTPDGRVID